MTDDCKIDIERLHTTALGAERIRRNLGLSPDADPLACCVKLITSPGALTERCGKNIYVTVGQIRITVNASAMSVITAHKTNDILK
ncbi:MAG: DUF3781 domain-containing protein [Muribaculaceae bacterium]|nr:DUF3781 domain-containing protein [Muribaculaceae bacterium]